MCIRDRDVTGVGFKIADEIAHRVGIHLDSDFRIRSGIMYVLQQASLEGHTYLPEELLTRRACELLGVDASGVEKHYMDMAIDRKLCLLYTSTRGSALHADGLFSG